MYKPESVQENKTHTKDFERRYKRNYSGQKIWLPVNKQEEKN